LEGDAHIASMLLDSGLRTRSLPLEEIRSGCLQAFERAAVGADVLVCDAETEADLRALAEAAHFHGPRVLWVGSAGLAQHLPSAMGLGSEAGLTSELPGSAGPALFVVGSMSRNSKEQVRTLRAGSTARHIAIPPEVLLAGPAAGGWAEIERELREAPAQGCDVILGIAEGREIGIALRPRLTEALAHLSLAAADSAGALVATGGETARAVLDRWVVPALRLLGEVERGVPVSVAEGWRRALPVITKAGDFGSANTLLRCAELLHRVPAMLDQDCQNELGRLTDE
jgi:4-hydroxythreonine-4-phosphate dehydrogenase